MRLRLSLPSLAAFISAGLLSACAGPGAGAPPPGGSAEAGAPARACFQGSRIRNFTTPRYDTLLIRSMENRVYELSSLGACPDLEGSFQLGVNADSSAAMSLCPGDIARVTVRQAGEPRVCRMRVTRILSETEIEALPRPDRP